MDKQRMRHQAHAILRGISPLRREEASTLLVARLHRLPAWKQSPIVLLYAAMPKEMPTAPIAHAALSLGKRVALPRREDGDLPFRLTGSPAETMRYLRQVAAGAESIDAKSSWHSLPPGFFHSHSPVLVVVPALAFGEDGSRLGRGGGWYDRFLGSHGSTLYSVGACMHEQVVPHIPQHAYDQRVSLVLSG